MLKMTRSTITLIATLAVLLAAVGVAQAVNYQENFEGAGSNLSDFGYAAESVVGGGDSSIITGVAGTNATTSRLSAGAGSMRIAHGVDFTGADYVFFEYDALFVSGDNWAGITTATCCNNEGIMVGKGLSVDMRANFPQASGNTQDLGVIQNEGASLLNTPVHIRMDYDRSGTGAVLTVEATPVGGGTSYGTWTENINATEADNIDLLTHFYIQAIGGNDRVEIDNIVVGVVPEPTSLLLLSIGTLGLVVSSRRRRMR